jgi:hypothetical protein
MRAVTRLLHPGESAMRLLKAQRFQLTIGQVMIAVAVCTLGLSSPKLLVFASASILSWMLITGAMYSQTGRRVAEWCTLVVIIVVLLALTQPGVATNCRRGGRAASPNPPLQPPGPDATKSGLRPRAQRSVDANANDRDSEPGSCSDLR